MAVEILGIQIRQEERIKGISIGPGMVKISQFADDLTAFVADIPSAESLLGLVGSFGSFSGLTLNRDKSHFLTLGEDPNVSASLPGLQAVRKVKILGIWFSSKRSLMDHFLWNYKGSLDRIRGICDSWIHRDLSIKGKISVVNSLLISLVQYVASNSELPNQVLYELKKIIVHFVWNGRKPKIAYDTLIQEVSLGGLRLADLGLRTSVAKMTWIRRLVNNPDSFSGLFLASLAGETYLQCLLYGKVDSLPDGFRGSLFYSGVFQHWINLHGFSPATEEEIRGEVLWWNKRIKIGGSPFCWRDWLESGIWRVEDLLDPDDGHLLSHEELSTRFGIRASFLKVLQLHQSIPSAWRQQISPSGEHPGREALYIYLDGPHPLDILKESPKKLYSGLL